MNIKRALVTIGAMVGIAASCVVLPAGTANAASSCWDAGFRKDNGGGGTNEAYYCQNVAGTPVYLNDTTYANRVVGYLYTGTNWFVCTIDYGDYVGGPHPYRWVYTEADNGQWGWVKDTAIYSETNPIHYCDGAYS
jgi:hypothetical protein